MTWSVMGRMLARIMASRRSRIRSRRLPPQTVTNSPALAALPKKRRKPLPPKRPWMTFRSEANYGLAQKPDQVPKIAAADRYKLASSGGITKETQKAVAAKTSLDDIQKAIVSGTLG